MNKQEIREKMLLLRRERGSKELSLAICENITEMPEYKAAECVALFMPSGSEADITPLIIKTMREKRLFLPVTNEDFSLSFYECKSLSELTKGRFGILEPVRETQAENIDFMAVPGLAVSKDGYRVGYGKGCYDRFLKDKNIFTCAAVFSFQKLDFVPQGEFDVAVRAIADENEIIYTR